MIEFLANWFKWHGTDESISGYLAAGILIVFIALLSILADYLTKKTVLRCLAYFIHKNNIFEWDNILLERNVFHKLAHIVPAVIVYYFAQVFPGRMSIFIERFSSAYIVLVGILVLDSLLNSVDDIYRKYEISKYKPIKGYLQVVKIFIYIIGGIIIIATIINQSPFLLLSGIGALTAVLLLVFKDSLLGLVASIQLSTNDMVRIGDWIEMTKFGADGDIIDISLNTVKIKNFDNTVTTIPTYFLVSDSFKNWRGMQEAGGRRIKRSIYIDITSIDFCTEEMLQELAKVHYLADYIKRQKTEITKYNLEHKIDITHPVNGRRLTNIGLFRVYVQSYLKNHSQLHKEMTQLVRQLQPGEFGLPLEIYVFTKVTDWARYENIQSDIFDHLLSVIPRFGLRVFQNPTGYNIK